MNIRVLIIALYLLFTAAVIACTPRGPDNPPGVVLIIPDDGTTYTAQDHISAGLVEVEAVGVAIDAEDGVLPDAGLTWSTQKAGSTTWEPAGNGQRVTLRLANTETTETTATNMRTVYTIKLTAVDSDGNTAEDEATVTLILPL